MASRGGAFILFAVLCSVLVLAPQGAAKKPLVPAMFVFGDSLVDVGNNNHLDKCNATCKANYPRYGVDYPRQSPTGRFSNGYNLADQLAQLLGFAESPPALLSLSNASLFRQMSTGINFASGGSGLLPATGLQVCGEVLPMAEQVRSFAGLVRRSGSKDRMAADLISKSLIFISDGSNDLFEYADFVDLYAAGARKFSVLSPSLVGCCPFQRKVAKDTRDVDQSGCLGAANNLSRQLYPMIASMLQDLSLELPGMSYSLGDAIRMAEWIFSNTQKIGYNSTLDRACCGAGDFGASGCNSSVPMCQNRSSYFLGQVPSHRRRVGDHRQGALRRRHWALRPPDQRAAAGGAATMRTFGCE
ncbi:GDSL esterase/lipase [Dichanthelium oligosanthes]|uniref:GDSL esterase/lipase n=1 Tax=Dichanthelium oligosanthes TaxID=888268 RepID=A0A1E5UK86_9POAL|nr:GDSL esterase/lipase [Dichanthelium oligosanthes]